MANKKEKFLKRELEGICDALGFEHLREKGKVTVESLQRSIAKGISSDFDNKKGNIHALARWLNAESVLNLIEFNDSTKVCELIPKILGVLHIFTAAREKKYMITTYQGAFPENVVPDNTYKQLVTLQLNNGPGNLAIVNVNNIPVSLPATKNGSIAFMRKSYVQNPVPLIMYSDIYSAGLQQFSEHYTVCLPDSDDDDNDADMEDAAGSPWPSTSTHAHGASTSSTYNRPAKRRMEDKSNFGMFVTSELIKAASEIKRINTSPEYLSLNQDYLDEMKNNPKTRKDVETLSNMKKVIEIQNTALKYGSVLDWTLSNKSLTPEEEYEINEFDYDQVLVDMAEFTI